MNEQDQLMKSSFQTRQDHWGKLVSYFCITVIGLLVISIIYFIAARGLNMFIKDGVSFKDFLTGMTWDPTVTDAHGKPEVGAWPMIFTSFAVTILATLVATPLALAVAIFMTELAPKKAASFMQSVIELLVGIPSVVYGFVGLVVVVPFIRHLFGGTGSGILAAVTVLFVMVLPTITSMSIDSLKNVPKNYREASIALGATLWQTTYKVILRSAIPGILTAVIFGMARAFGEALAVQMVIGNAPLMPENLISPASTLTSTLTVGIGNTVMGTLPNDALWSLALVLMLMSLAFNLLVKLVNKKGVSRNA